jgi:hypothetical protein
MSQVWTNPLTIALVAAGAAILGSLLTIFLTPQLQHYFWRKQRGDELRLAAIDELNRLAAEFLNGHIATTPATFRPSAEWFKAFSMLDAKIKVFFPKKYKEFKTLEELIPGTAGGLGPMGKQGVHDFVEARDAALRALYEEVIPTG